MAEEEVTKRLDVIIAILKVVHQDDIAVAREKVMNDKVYSAILELAADWMPAGELQRAVAERTNQSERTFRNKASELVEMGALQRSGGGAAVSYRRTELF